MVDPWDNQDSGSTLGININKGKRNAKIKLYMKKNN